MAINGDQWRSMAELTFSLTKFRVVSLRLHLSHSLLEDIDEQGGYRFLNAFFKPPILKLVILYSSIGRHQCDRRLANIRPLRLAEFLWVSTAIV
jgi:hypothetical protein